MNENTEDLLKAHNTLYNILAKGLEETSLTNPKLMLDTLLKLERKLEAI